MIDLLKYKPQSLKIEVKKIEVFNFSSEKRGRIELETLMKKILKEDIELNELKIFLVNIKKVFTFIKEEEVFKLINSIKIKKLDSKVDYLEKYIYYSILEMQEYDRFNFLYTHLNRLGKNLYKFMDFPDANDYFRANFQKTFQRNYNKTFQDFLVLELKKETNSSGESRFCSRYFLDKNSKIYLEIIEKVSINSV